MKKADVRKQVLTALFTALICVATMVIQIPTPMTGGYVNVGDVVKRGDKLMMYEAMKMENNFLAEVDGTIKEIKVRVGDNILQGAVLFVIG